MSRNDPGLPERSVASCGIPNPTSRCPLASDPEHPSVRGLDLKKRELGGRRPIKQKESVETVSDSGASTGGTGVAFRWLGETCWLLSVVRRSPAAQPGTGLSRLSRDLPLRVFWDEMAHTSETLQLQQRRVERLASTPPRHT